MPLPARFSTCPNPESLTGEKDSGTEGCLSFPDITAEIDRAASVELEAETLDGEKITIEASGLLARALQHEADHLNGILFIDRMSSAAKASLAKSPTLVCIIASYRYLERSEDSRLRERQSA